LVNFVVNNKAKRDIVLDTSEFCYFWRFFTM